MIADSVKGYIYKYLLGYLQEDFKLVIYDSRIDRINIIAYDSTKSVKYSYEFLYDTLIDFYKQGKLKEYLDKWKEQMLSAPIKYS